MPQVLPCPERYTHAPCRAVPCSAPVFLTGARSLRVGVGSRLAEAIAKRRPEGDLDAVPASWTIEAEEDGPAQHQRCLNEPD